MKYAITVQVRLNNQLRPAPLLISPTDCRWTSYTPYIGLGVSGEIIVEPMMNLIGSSRSRAVKRNSGAASSLPSIGMGTWLGVSAAAEFTCVDASAGVPKAQNSDRARQA